MIVFKGGDPIYHSKLLTFYRKENFELEAVYAHPTPSMHVPLIGMCATTCTCRYISPRVAVLAFFVVIDDLYQRILQLIRTFIHKPVGDSIHTIFFLQMFTSV